MLVPGAAPVPQVAPVPSAYPMTPQPGQYNPYMMVKPAAVQIKEMNDMFMWFWICLAGSIITFGASAIASIVLMYIMLYRFWKLIQDGYARTTPGKAIGFMFIPFYNFYWIFQAIPGWAKDANAFIARRNLPIAPIDTTLPTVYCILLLCSAIPYVDFLTGPAALVIMIIMLNRFKNAANQIIQYTQQ
jgi:hypothetical protein